jgi:two-component system chemotaxis response regulator CheY
MSASAAVFSAPFPRTVLVVDDHESIRELVCSVLTTRGFSVVAAEDGASALDLVAETPVDAVVTDVDLPEMNGLDLCRALRRIADVRGRPFLAWLMSGFVNSDLLARATAAGAQGVLVKPFAIGDLVARVEQLFSATEHPLFAA